MTTGQSQNAGLANVTAALQAYASRPLYQQWGTGTGAARSANVVTTTGTAENRGTGTSSQQTISIANDTYQVISSQTATGTRAITEAGLFDAAGTGSPPTGGNMDLYGSFAVINLSTGDILQITWQWQFT